MRVGEAAHPGPDTHDGLDQHTFTIGTFNPTGILHKAHLLKELDQPAIWGITESHLTKAGCHCFRTELAAEALSMRYVPGAFAPPLSSSPGAIGGKSTGVGILSSWPVRALNCTWDTDLWLSARLQACAVFVGGHWLKLGVAYGYSGDTYTHSTMDKTDLLLAQLTERIVHQSHGPRILMGDFNHAKNSLAQFEIWRQAGFVEVQELALQRWGRAIAPTSKRQTTIDHLWISAELQALLCQVNTDDTVFPDHSVLTAKFKMPTAHEPVPVWRKPLPIPWDDVGPLTDQDEIPPDAPRHDFQAVFCTMEKVVDQKLRRKDKPGLLSQQKGRCCTTAPSLKHHIVTPLRKSRPSEVQIEFLGEHFVHTKWCRQLRRIQSMCHLLRSRKPTRDIRIQQIQLWASIRRAPGFPRGFPHAWENRSTRTHGSPAVLPKAVPTREVCDAIFTCFHADFKLLEKALIQARSSAAKARRAANPNVCFKDVSRSKAQPVQTLVKDIQAEVTLKFQSAPVRCGILLTR